MKVNIRGLIPTVLLAISSIAFGYSLAKELFYISIPLIFPMSVSAFFIGVTTE